MSGEGAPRLAVRADGATVAVIAAAWHPQIIEVLASEAATALQEAGAAVRQHSVAGSFELPLAAQQALAAGADAVIALGVIVRGQTPHFEYVSQAVTHGLLRVTLDAGKPVGFGILTVDTLQQAIDRSGLPGAPENKGREAAEAVLASLALGAQLQRD